MSLDLGQLREHVIRPALEWIELWSPAAENLVLGTALVESRAQYLKQLGTGPALGLFQMEPATYADLYDNYIQYRRPLESKLDGLRSQRYIAEPLHERARELVGNLPYAAAMCRVHYRRSPKRIPEASDALGMSELWKEAYNTPLGAGTVEKALPHFEVACGD